jgi:superfamily I DNA and RNA helicase
LSEPFRLSKLVKIDLKTGEKSLIIYYDDAQNTYARTRPVWKTIGIDVQRGDRSKIMKNCLRNTQEILSLGFNVLLGKQSLDCINVSNRTFADIQTLKHYNLIEETESFFRIKFAEQHGNKPLVYPFSSRESEKEWVAQELVRLIRMEHVKPEEILIQFDGEKGYEDLEEYIRRHLGPNEIAGFVRPYYGNRVDQDKYIFRENHITISTTRGAKGYDSGVVFLIGVDNFAGDNVGRASFYVGCTRARAALYVSGIITGQDTLLSECLRIWGLF